MEQSQLDPSVVAALYVEHGEELRRFLLGILRDAQLTADVLRIPVGPFVYFMAGMIFLTALVHVFKVFVPGTRRASQATN